MLFVYDWVTLPFLTTTCKQLSQLFINDIKLSPVVATKTQTPDSPSSTHIELKICVIIPPLCIWLQCNIMCAGKRRKKHNCILSSCNMALVSQISYKNREPFCHGEVQRHAEHAKTSLWDEGLCDRNRAAQQGCGDSERGISLGRIHVFISYSKKNRRR